MTPGPAGNHPTRRSRTRFHIGSGIGGGGCDMVSPKRNALQAETIGAAQCLKSWDKNGIFDISKAFDPKGGGDMEVGA